MNYNNLKKPEYILSDRLKAVLKDEPIVSTPIQNFNHLAGSGVNTVGVWQLATLASQSKCCLIVPNIRLKQPQGILYDRREGWFSTAPFQFRFLYFRFLPPFDETVPPPLDSERAMINQHVNPYQEFPSLRSELGHFLNPI